MQKRCLKFILAASLLTAGLCRTADAALGIKLEIDHKVILQYEALTALITIHNDSDETFVLDADDPNNNSTFNLELKQKDEVIGRLKPKTPIVSNLKIKPDQTRKIMVMVSDWYSLARMGPYKLTVAIDDGDETYVSKTVDLDIVQGIELEKIKKKAKGVHSGARTYSLLYWRRESYEFLFLKVYDDKLNYGTINLGTVIRVEKPKLKVDRKGNVTVFHQARPTRYLLTKFKSDYKGLTFIDQSRVEAE